MTYHPNVPEYFLPSLALLLLLLGSWACGGETTVQAPLLDDQHTPQVLIEDIQVHRPPTDNPNRFLSGWTPWRYESPDGTERIALGVGKDGARLQLVKLTDQARVLALDLVDVEGPDEERRGRVRVEAKAGNPHPAPARFSGVFPLSDPFRVELPGGLPRGRLIVEITPLPAEGSTEHPPFDVLETRLSSPALGLGGADRGEIAQTLTSRVELVRRVEPGWFLTGDLLYLPPRDSSSSGDPSARVTVTGEGGRILDSFVWEKGWRERVPLGVAAGFRQHSFHLSTGDEAGLVHLSFEAEAPEGWEGSVDEATRAGTFRWRNLRWERPSAPEHDSRADSPPAAGSDAAGLELPEVVVLYVMDALRADHVGHLGGPEGISPTWDRLAREGATFRNHRVNAPSTLPSTRALMTGHAYRVPGEWEEVSPSYTFLAEAFRQAGYRTGLFSGNAFVSDAYGLDRGFEHVDEGVHFRGEDGEGHDGGSAPGDGASFNDNAARVQAAALSWLDRLGSGERAFLYLHTIHPHNPFDPPPELEEHFAGGVDSAIDGSTDTLMAVRDGERELTEADRERLRQLYAASFAYNDRQLAELVEALEERHGEGEVLLVLTSDHGEELFDHGGVLHGYTFYEEMLQVPLTFWWPGTIPPTAVETPTDTLDLHATLGDLLTRGGKPGNRRAGPDAEAFVTDGRSLLGLLLGESGREGGGDAPVLQFSAAPTVRDGIYSALALGGPYGPAGGLKLVRTTGGGVGWGMGKGLGRTRDPAYFFDLRTDPEEEINRTGSGGLEELWLRSRLRAWIAAGEPHRRGDGDGAEADGDDRLPEGTEELDEETRERLRSLGYLQ